MNYSFTTTSQGVYNFTASYYLQLVCSGGTINLVSFGNSPNYSESGTKTATVDTSAYAGQSCYLQSYVWGKTANSYECTSGYLNASGSAVISY